MLSKRYESTEVDRRTWLHVPSGDSLVHQFIATGQGDCMRKEYLNSKIDVL